MRNEYNGKEADYVYSEKEIEYVFDNFQKQYMPNISDENYIDLYYRILYFFNHSRALKLSPENNDDLYYEEYGESNTEHKSLMTVPKNLNKYVDFEKGTFIPVCRFKKTSPKKSYDNEFVISIDVERNIVWANVTTTKHVYKIKNKNQPLKSHCYCVANYCIPNVTEIVRGKSEDILNGKVADIKPLEFSSDIDKFEEVISQCVLHVGRMDIDVEHRNRYFFDDGRPMFSDEEMNVLGKYFGEVAGPPHFHFIYKDYVLALNSHDSSALAINVNGLTSYLNDLYFVDENSNSAMLKYDFGMPFNDIKRSNMPISYEKASELMSGISSIYESISEEEKQEFISTLFSDLKQRSKHINRTSSPRISEKYDTFMNNINNLCAIITSNGNSPLNSTEFDPITVLTFEASALNQIYKLSFTNKNLKFDIAKAGNNIYNTIEFCLSEISKLPQELASENLHDNEVNGLN